jgi:hypothetical protein
VRVLGLQLLNCQHVFEALHARQQLLDEFGGLLFGSHLSFSVGSLRARRRQII